jgi:hypothetical protein
MRTTTRLAAVAAAVLLLALFTVPLSAQQGENKAFAVVKTILADRCSGCHDWARSPETLSDAGIIVPGNAEGSKMYQMIAEDAMPMTGSKLTADQKEIIRAWIAAGAPQTGEGSAAAPAELPSSPAPIPRPQVNIPLHMVSGFTSSGLFLAAGIVGAVHFFTMLDAGHAWLEANYGSAEPTDAARAAMVEYLWNDPTQQALRWTHVGLLASGDLFYLWNAITGTEMIISPPSGRPPRADIHRLAFFTHAGLLAAQLGLGLLSTYALSSGNHELVSAVGAAHLVVGVAIPTVMITAGVLNILP